MPHTREWLMFHLIYTVICCNKLTRDGKVYRNMLRIYLQILWHYVQRTFYPGIWERGRTWNQFPVAPRNNGESTSWKRQQIFQKSKIISVHSSFSIHFPSPVKEKQKRKDHVNHESSILFHVLYYSCLGIRYGFLILF